MSGDLKNRIDAIDSNAKGLITAAENKTGDQFENLPAAVNELIEGYGQGALKNMTITCTASDGITVTGVVIEIRNGIDNLLYTTVNYEGQPVTIEIPQGFDYSVKVKVGIPHYYFNRNIRGIVYDDVSILIDFTAFAAVNTFPELKQIIEEGRGGEVEIGRQLTMPHSVFGNLIWRLSDWDAETQSAICEMVDCLPAITGTGTSTWDGLAPFDAPEALAGATGTWANGFPAGSYKFKNSSTYYYFTLTESVPAGGQIRATKSAFYSYESSASFEAIETGSVSTTEIVGATDLGTAGAGELNHLDRVTSGSNDYEESNLRQWLNSYGSAGSWFSPKTRFDRVNENLASREGFCKGISQDVLSVIDDATVRCYSSSYVSPDSTHGGSRPYTVTEKFFLLSEKQVYGSSSIDEGDSQLDIYYDTAPADKIKRRQGTTTVCNWYLRTPYGNYAYYERRVTTGGNASFEGAASSNGILPACKISKSTVEPTLEELLDIITNNLN